MTFYKWSRTAAADATADSTINWAEGMAPSAVNDSARAMMAATAKHRDDIAGAIVTGGTSTAYTVASYQIFDTLANMNGQMIAFTPHATNGATVTLNVDGLGAKPLRSSPGVELLAGTLIFGTPYTALYNNSDSAWYLSNFYGNAYNIPLGAGMDYWLPTAPNSAFVFPIGQAISRTTYATLFSAMGTQYGPGDGSSTFNLPDKMGRVSAMKEAVANTRLSSTYFGGNSAALGATGGAESNTLTTAQMPSHTHPVTDPGHTHSVTGAGSIFINAAGGTLPLTGGQNYTLAASLNAASNTTGISIQTAGSGSAHANVQPTILCNYIIRII